MKTYENFIEKIKEGLITTHNINIYKSTLTTYLDQIGVKYELEIIDKLDFNLTLHINDFEIVELANHQCYVLGYFPSYYWVILKDNKKNSFKEIDKLPSNTKEVIIKYESKYDDGLYKNTIICPDILYHLSPQKNKKSILSKGLYPKSKKRLSAHPERLYLFDEVDEYQNLLKKLKNTDLNDKNYLLLKIDCNKDRLILHTDPNYRLGYFTYDNISPDKIEILKENL